VDLLTDILEQAGLRRRLLNSRALAPGSALRFPCERSIGFHVVTRGQVYLHAPAIEGPLLLQAGDIALMARGCEHLLSAEAALPAGPIPSVLDAPAATPAAAPDPAPERSDHSLFSGAYQLWNTPVHPLFAELPAWAVVRGDSLPRLSPLSLTVALLGQESARDELGADTIVHGLLDVAFTYLLREVLGRDGEARGGWGQAVRGPQIRRVLEYLHAEPARDWTLDTLAREAGLSRTALAQKFRLAMDDTPLNYLRMLRMQRAMRLLSETDDTLETVAAAVGYQDAFGFSRVFKRTVGLAPRDFRRQDAADKALAWRI
jgi:AraC-like DNA-binding protein